MQARMQASPNPSVLPLAAGTLPVKRSTFVSIIAWVLIVLSAFGMLGFSQAGT